MPPAIYVYHSVCLLHSSISVSSFEENNAKRIYTYRLFDNIERLDKASPGCPCNKTGMVCGGLQLRRLLRYQIRCSLSSCDIARNSLLFHKVHVAIAVGIVLWRVALFGARCSTYPCSRLLVSLENNSKYRLVRQCKSGNILVISRLERRLKINIVTQKPSGAL